MSGKCKISTAILVCMTPVLWRTEKIGDFLVVLVDDVGIRCLFWRCDRHEARTIDSIESYEFVAETYILAVQQIYMG